MFRQLLNNLLERCRTFIEKCKPYDIAAPAHSVILATFNVYIYLGSTVKSFLRSTYRVPTNIFRSTLRSNSCVHNSSNRSGTNHNKNPTTTVHFATLRENLRCVSRALLALSTAFLATVLLSFMCVMTCVLSVASAVLVPTFFLISVIITVERHSLSHTFSVIKNLRDHISDVAVKYQNNSSTINAQDSGPSFKDKVRKAVRITPVVTNTAISILTFLVCIPFVILVATISLLIPVVSFFLTTPLVALKVCTLDREIIDNFVETMKPKVTNLQDIPEELLVSSKLSRDTKLLKPSSPDYLGISI